MTKTACVLGAMGQIGRPAVRALAEDGWDVLALSLRGGRAPEWPPGVETRAVDRREPGALEAALGDGVDVLVDCVAYDTAEAAQLTALAGRVGSLIVVSSVSVYTDASGRGFDTQEDPDGFPHYPLPITETQSTVAPGPATYSTRKMALETALLGAADRLPVTLLRPGAIHGPFCRAPRELYFVKRALDRRPVRILLHGGTSRFHTSGTGVIAELIRLAAARPGTRVLNAVDPQAPTVAEIATALDALTGHRCETVLLDGGPPAPGVGLTPWSVPLPVVMDMSAAERELGYRAPVDYAGSLPATVDWLTSQLAGSDWKSAFPVLARGYGGIFDYAAEDAWLASRS